MDAKAFRKTFERYMNHVNFFKARLQTLKNTDEESAKNISDCLAQLNKYRHLQNILLKTYQINHVTNTVRL